MNLARPHRRPVARAHASSRGATLLELGIAIGVLAVFLGGAAICYGGMIHRAKEAALRTELRNLRGVISFFEARKRARPADLRELENAGFTKYVPLGTSGKRPYFEFLSKDEAGYPLDPFGNRYVYDTRNGSVSSRTEGYRDW